MSQDNTDQQLAQQLKSKGQELTEEYVQNYVDIVKESINQHTIEIQTIDRLNNLTMQEQSLIKDQLSNDKSEGLYHTHQMDFETKKQLLIQSLSQLDDVEASINVLETNIDLMEQVVVQLENRFAKVQ
eukprot:403377550